ncbi:MULTISPECIES: phage major capsid protein, P2 family [unclassified Paraburkholderia]|uniref:phage major capsid protein, P2 family n=1 Tax=unclassified Paraburkholderia TaxID=2615204 RepID=UPI00160C5455|nr:MULTISPECIES: phage major capsid protein, P2 family [unclassified Paraburkholderia]MBB5447094.1 P2 family phage major capsid protein [Paraburkholderia sp. WSM4177]MBB5487635.1 P2 family phage major capsid protein [Paraburkholderia sp. WSM4180]
MTPQTRAAIEAYSSRIAQLNGVPTASQQFNVAPSVQQTLEKRIQESTAFLGAINVIGVTAQQGEKLGLLVGSTIASTTDTSAKEREPFDPTDMDPNAYMCTQTNFDTALNYSKLDAWAHMPNFQTMIRQMQVVQTGLDRIRIGLNGTSRAATSDREQNPNLEDVNVGWLEKFRTQAPAQVMSDAIVIGPGGDYKNPDALVHEAVNSLIAPWHADNPELVVLCGRETLLDRYFVVLNDDNRPVDQLAAATIVSQQRMGGIKAMRVPFMPRGKLFITLLKNLSLYWQIGGRRSTLIDNPKRDRYEFFNSSNDAYVVEDYEAGCLIDDVEFAGAAALAEA